MGKSLTNLEWHLQMGVDETIENLPVNRFEKKAQLQKKENVEMPREKKAENKPLVAEPKQVQAVRKPEIVSPASAIYDTRKIADSCNNLDELRSAVMNFKDISIAKTAINTVFSDGVASSEIMLIGEAPGAEEDAQGIPFCGASGKLLDQMLECIGIMRDKNFYITNTIFWRPPGNRRPTPEELAICLPFVEKHIALVKPKIIVLVGGTAVASLIDSKTGITKIRGSFFDYNNQYLGEPVKTTAIFHPSYLLRSPGQKRVAWKDLLTIKEFITNNKIKI